MSLLIDQNISFRILRNLSDLFPDAVHIKEIHLENASDIEIWNYAKEKGLCIVTFDSDFNDFSNLFGYPPKVIWVRTLDQSTSNVERLVHEKFEKISDFIKSPTDFGCLEILG